MALDTTSLYTILEVEETATQDEIRGAFRRLARVHHPDVGGDEGDFKEIVKAYEVLGDPGQRAQYSPPRQRYKPPHDFGDKGDLGGFSYTTSSFANSTIYDAIRKMQDALRNDGWSPAADDPLWGDAAPGGSDEHLEYILEELAGVRAGLWAIQNEINTTRDSIAEMTRDLQGISPYLADAEAAGIDSGQQVLVAKLVREAEIVRKHGDAVRRSIQELVDTYRASRELADHVERTIGKMQTQSDWRKDWGSTRRGSASNSDNAQTRSWYDPATRQWHFRP